MKKTGSILLLFCFLMAFESKSQNPYTKNGSVSFFSKAVLENIEASSGQVISVINTTTGDIMFSVNIKSFHFKKSLMEEHFNENYMESDKYPKASFKGKINNLSAIIFSTDGSYNTEVTGDLTIHGITNKVTVPGKIVIKAGVPTATASFRVKLADYKISIPRVVKDNIAEVVEVNLSCVYNHKL